jgi:hypothetical protein
MIVSLVVQAMHKYSDHLCPKEAPLLSDDPLVQHSGVVCSHWNLPPTKALKPRYVSPRVLLPGGSNSSGLMACRCLATAHHAWLVEVCLCTVLSCKAFPLTKRGGDMSGSYCIEVPLRFT